MSTQISSTLEILSTEVAKVDIDPETATTEFVEGDIPVLQLVIRIGDDLTPCNVILEQSQCLRLRDMINKAFDDPNSWLYTSKDVQETLRCASDSSQ